MAATNVAGTQALGLESSIDHGATAFASSGSSTPVPTRIAYIPSVRKWFVSENDGTLLPSLDGLSFGSYITTGSGNLGTRVVEGPPGILVCGCSNNGVSTRSADGGVTWGAQSIPGFDCITALTYGAGLFVAVGYIDNVLLLPVIKTSPDGITWTSRTVPAAHGYLECVTYKNGLFVAGGNNAAQNGIAMCSSVDGITWTNRHSGLTGLALCVEYGKGLYVAGCSDGSTITSPDGITWTPRAVQNSITVINDMSFDTIAGIFFGVCNGPLYVIKSTDGITFVDCGGVANNTRCIGSANPAEDSSALLALV